MVVHSVACSLNLRVGPHTLCQMIYGLDSFIQFFRVLRSTHPTARRGVTLFMLASFFFGVWKGVRILQKYFWNALMVSELKLQETRLHDEATAGWK